MTKAKFMADLREVLVALERTDDATPVWYHLRTEHGVIEVEVVNNEVRLKVHMVVAGPSGDSRMGSN